MNLAEESEPRSDPAAVRRVFRKESHWSHVFGAAYEQVRRQPAMMAGLAALAVFVVFLVGFAIGGGFSADTPVDAATGDYFITVEQASELRQQAIELQEANSSLAIVEGEAAYLRNENESLATDVETLQSSFNELQVEMGIVIGIYEECMARLYPAECVAAARPRAEAFLEELFSRTP